MVVVGIVIHKEVVNLKAMLTLLVEAVLSVMRLTLNQILLFIRIFGDTLVNF